MNQKYIFVIIFLLQKQNKYPLCSEKNNQFLQFNYPPLPPLSHHLDSPERTARARIATKTLMMSTSTCVDTKHDKKMKLHLFICCCCCSNSEILWSAVRASPVRCDLT